MPLLLPKDSFGRGIAAPLPVNTLKQKHWGGRGAGTPAPQLPLSPAKFGAANYAALFKERTKNITLAGKCMLLRFCRPKYNIVIQYCQ